MIKDHYPNILYSRKKSTVHHLADDKIGYVVNACFSIFFTYE